MPPRDDILSILTRADTQPLTAGMGTAGGAAGYGQGRIIAWDPGSFANQIAYRGGVLSNVPVLSGPDALTFRAGDTVAVVAFSPNGGATSYFILGRIIVPGEGRGSEAIAWMTSELGRALAAAVFADRIQTKNEGMVGYRPVGGYGDLLAIPGLPTPPPTPGPYVEIDITSAGKALVFISCAVKTLMSAGDLQQSGNVGVDVTGATVSPADHNDSLLWYYQPTASGSGTAEVRATCAVEIPNLNQGPHRFALKYNCGNSSDPGEVHFYQRTITVMGF